MIMPNDLSAYKRKMSGAELKKTVRNFVEGYQGGFNPFNRGSLPVVSGISVEIKETEDGYTLSKVTKNEKPVQDEDSELGDFVEDQKTTSPYEATNRAILREELDAVLKTLSPREEKVKI